MFFTKAKFFCKTIVPPPPEDVTAMRINGTHINVTWMPIPLTRSKGFIQSYTVTYSSSQSGLSKRETLEKLISGQESSNTVIGGLQPAATYDVQVAAITIAGMGESSPPISSKSKIS